MKSITQLNEYENTFNDRYLSKLWREVKEDVWGDLRIEQQKMLKRLLESSMEEEVNDLIVLSPLGT